MRVPSFWDSFVDKFSKFQHNVRKITALVLLELESNKTKHDRTASMPKKLSYEMNSIRWKLMWGFPSIFLRKILPYTSEILIILLKPFLEINCISKKKLNCVIPINKWWSHVSRSLLTLILTLKSFGLTILHSIYVKWWKKILLYFDLFICFWNYRLLGQTIFLFDRKIQFFF